MYKMPADIIHSNFCDDHNFKLDTTEILNIKQLQT